MAELVSNMEIHAGALLCQNYLGAQKEKNYKETNS
jgi:hypothetical protein